MKLQAQLKSAKSPLIMGIVNVTPDSFSDGGNYNQLDLLKQRIETLAEEGADIIDIGGESARPGATEVSLDEELRRILPAIEMAKNLTDCMVSVDSCKPEVMREALDLNVDLINDVCALTSDGALEVCANSTNTNAMFCLMHMQGKPRTMQNNPVYQDVVKEVREFLQSRVKAAAAAGIDKNRLIIDPGFGFGKNLAHNTQLFKQLASLSFEQIPLLVGVSRKSMFGDMLGLKVDQRLHASVTAAVLAAQRGAKILRVHDVLPTKQALQVELALREELSAITEEQ